MRIGIFNLEVSWLQRAELFFGDSVFAVKIQQQIRHIKIFDLMAIDQALMDGLSAF